MFNKASMAAPAVRAKVGAKRDPRQHGRAGRGDAAMMAAAATLQGAAPMAPTTGRLAAPSLALREPSVTGMPRSRTQEVRVLTATFEPGDRTVFHQHRSPVTVYVLEGHFTLELEGRAPIVVGPGEAFVEPPEVPHTGYNRSATERLRVVVFYVSEPETPFLDPLV